MRIARRSHPFSRLRRSHRLRSNRGDFAKPWTGPDFPANATACSHGRRKSASPGLLKWLRTAGCAQAGVTVISLETSSERPAGEDGRRPHHSRRRQTVDFRSPRHGGTRGRCRRVRHRRPTLPDERGHLRGNGFPALRYPLRGNVRRARQLPQLRTRQPHRGGIRLARGRGRPGRAVCLGLAERAGPGSESDDAFRERLESKLKQYQPYHQRDRVDSPS